GPSVSLASYAAGEEGAANLTFTPSNPIPSDGHIIVEFPSNFTTVNSTSAVSLWGLDGGFIVSVDGYTVDVQRDGTGSDLSGGMDVTVQLLWSGASGVFPSVMTTRQDAAISIDEASAAFNSVDRPSGVVFTPGAFQGLGPSVSLASYAAGEEGAANLTFTPSNPIPSDGHIIVEFPSNFTTVNSTSAVSLWGLDGGFIVSVDGYTVDVQRDGTGSDLSGGMDVTVQLVDGVKNQQFEGESGVFPVFKTTLNDTDTAIDVASSWHNKDDRPDGVLFIPGSFAKPPNVTLDSLVAGVEGAVNLSVTLSNPLPVDAHVLLEFPATFKAIHTPSLVLADGVDGGLNASVWADGYTVDIERDGSGTEVTAGTQIAFSLMGCAQNQLWSGASGVFPSVMTTRQDAAISIDEASAAFNSVDRPSGVVFTPGAFQGLGPSVSLASYAAGEEGAANLTFTPSNPIPSDGHIIVEFPSNFTTVNSTSAVSLWGLDGGFIVSVDGYTVDVQRDGTGSDLSGGMDVTVQLVDGVKNQQFEGESGVFPVFKTTLNDTDTAIDVASSWHNRDDRPDGVLFIPGSFAKPPNVTLDSLVAGVEGAVNLSVTLSNPLPVDAHVLLEFPATFAAIHTPSLVLADGVDGGLNASVWADGYTVDIERDGSGTEVTAGTQIAFSLMGCAQNQLWSGASGVFPSVMTTRQDSAASIDEASAAFNSVDRPSGVVFTPGAFQGLGPSVSLASYAAGEEGAANLTFTPSNPIPSDGHIIVEFPSNFTTVNSTSAVSLLVLADGVDGGLNASVWADGYTVDIERDGSGTEVTAGTQIAFSLMGCAQNQLWSGASGVFPSVMTTRQDAAISIDEASAAFNSVDRPSGVVFTPGAFQGLGPSVSLASYAAGEEGAANLTFTPSNPIPSDGHIIVEFPSNFTTVNSTSAVSLWGLDGGFIVSVDGYTVDVQRDGTGSDLSGGMDVTVQLVDGVKNQQFEGESGVFPVFKTTLNDTDTAIDVAS
ncbi:unnamed protein product, partial [Pylaiella littoralis]